jgi:hypothetical protein
MTGINAEGLSALAGILLSLGFSYIPGVSQRFGELAPTQKRLVMLGLLLACALGVFGLSCAQTGWLEAPSCDQAGAWGLAKVFLAAVIANQAAFTVSPRPERPRQTGTLIMDRPNPLKMPELLEEGNPEQTNEAAEAERITRRVRRQGRPEGAYARKGNIHADRDKPGSEATQNKGSGEK